MYLVVYWTNRALITPDLTTSPLVWSLIGFLMWYYVAIVVGSLSTSLQNEATEGTLEQLLLTPAGPSRLLFARLVAIVLRGSLEVLLILGGLILLTGVHLVWRIIPSLMVMGLSMIGLAGLGFALAALTLLYKRVGGLVGLFNLGMLVMMGVLGGRQDTLVQVLAAVLPLVQGSRLMQQLFSSEMLDPAAWVPQMSILALNSAGYLIVGLILFTFADRHARRRGIVGQF
jgi:ABC-2 type transport system permease protein